MAKACLSCGTVNVSNAKFCSGCGKALSPKKTAKPSRTQAGGVGGKPVLCDDCKEPRRVTGEPFIKWIPHPPPIDQYEEEWVCYVLKCGHHYPFRKTGRTRDREI